MNQDKIDAIYERSLRRFQSDYHELERTVFKAFFLYSMAHILATLILVTFWVWDTLILFPLPFVFARLIGRWFDKKSDALIGYHLERTDGELTEIMR